MIRFVIAAALALLLAHSASGQYYRSSCETGYCQPTYSAPTYHYSTPTYRSTPTYSAPSVTYPYYSGWEWRQWDTDPTYWVRVRWHHFTYESKALENDGWLYTKSAYGEWVRHCRIGEYSVAKPVVYPLGRTEAGYFEPVYRLVQQAPYLAKPGTLIAKTPADAIDPRDFLVPFQDDGPTRSEAAFKSQTSATELALQVVKSEQAKELAQLQTRAQLARDALAAQNDERFLSEIKELFALRQKSATIRADADSGAAVVAIENADTAAMVRKRCFECHGGSKGVGGSIDFRKPLTAEELGKCFRSAAAGTMPKEGQPLSSEELDLLQEEWLAAVKRSK